MSVSLLLFKSHCPKYGLAYTFSLPISNLISSHYVCIHYKTAHLDIDKNFEFQYITLPISLPLPLL